ncbi:MAG: DegT/DnrJ/EryC1/StrS family aminotransferase [Bacteroidota bacterium]
MNNKLRLPLANSTWDDREYDAIYRVIKSDRFTMGPEVKKFEKQFASYIGSEFAIMVNSGSSANLIAISSLIYSTRYNLKKGDEVIVPAVSWATTYYPLYQYGLRLKFVDIDLNTLNFNIEALQEAVSEKTCLIMAVNLLGNPNDFDKINDIIKNKDILLVEDNCESLGATYCDKHAGTVGVLGTFSSFFSHHISTMEGGIVVTDDEELYHILLSLRAHGWTRDLPNKNRILIKSQDPFNESFNFVLPGYNLRPLEISGAIGQEQLNKLDEIVKWRRFNAKKIKELMKDNPNFLLQKEIGNSSWFGFSIILSENNPLSRSEVLYELSESGIECRPIVAGNFTKNKAIKYFDYSIHGELDNANFVHERGFFVGNHHYDLTNEIEFVSNLLNSF